MIEYTDPSQAVFIVNMVVPETECEIVSPTSEQFEIIRVLIDTHNLIRTSQHRGILYCIFESNYFYGVVIERNGDVHSDRFDHEQIAGLSL